MSGAKVGSGVITDAAVAFAGNDCADVDRVAMGAEPIDGAAVAPVAQ